MGLASTVKGCVVLYRILLHHTIIKFGELEEISTHLPKIRSTRKRLFSTYHTPKLVSHGPQDILSGFVLYRKINQIKNTFELLFQNRYMYCGQIDRQESLIYQQTTYLLTRFCLVQHVHNKFGWLPLLQTYIHFHTHTCVCMRASSHHVCTHAHTIKQQFAHNKTRMIRTSFKLTLWFSQSFMSDWKWS